MHNENCTNLPFFAKIALLLSDFAVVCLAFWLIAASSIAEGELFIKCNTFFSGCSVHCSTKDKMPPTRKINSVRLLHFIRHYIVFCSTCIKHGTVLYFLLPILFNYYCLLYLILSIHSHSTHIKKLT